jgi:hypothetical protein
MANTTNFGWETPDDTDLVKDGAAAMRTLGNSIDASFVDLKGGTTGQILSKNSNTDLDYIWIANDQGDITAVTAGTGMTGGGTSGAVTLTNDMATTITAAGDIVVGTGSGTYDNLPIGTTGQVLTADTTVSPYKVKWAAAGAGFVGCKLTKTAAQTISNNSATALTWDNEIFDTDGFHDNATNNTRITIPTGKDGKYLVLIQNRWDTNATGTREHLVYKNGGSAEYQLVTMTAASAGRTRYTASVILSLVAGDYLESMAYQTSGGNLAVDYTEQTMSFSVQYLGA